jgi:hydrogenase maturation protein HypF
MPFEGRHIEIRGVVQGVGFRPFVYQAARRLGITGLVRNDSKGVMIDAFGEDRSLANFVGELQSNPPPASSIRSIEWSPIPFESVRSFEIVASETTADRRVSIPPDLAICDACLREIFDPTDRRYLYPFTNCTNCGPRYSIVRDIPYDRKRTTMDSFEMCRACRAEYENPADRRFHAQPNACPQCGPAVTAITPDGSRVATDSPIGFAARALRAQLIVAVKGIGGFHLACDATSSVAVQRLRERKRRDAKPLAVMVRDLAAAEQIAFISPEEKRLLLSAERPIVLLERKGTLFAKEVTGENPLIGVLLAYTPLHHILLREARLPLVMTSGNVSDEPMVTDNGEALRSLREVADVFLMHNREIETRIDDSVIRVIASKPTILRRGRGYVPGGVVLERSFSEPVLACGAHLKNAICIGAGDAAFVGPHIGDLESVSTLRAFEASVAQMKRFLGVDPGIVAHDLHPDYFSTRFAQTQDGARLVGVQHHHAHIVAVMAEHGVTGRVLGVSYDGTGYGLDGTSWGGEVMIADEIGFERFAAFRPIPLPGGDQAIRQVWRIALAALDDAFDGEPPLNALPLFSETPRRAVESIRRMVTRKFNAPLARGVGRYFDALGAIGLSMPVARYEGEIAFLWNMAADRSEQGRYPVVVRDGVQPWEIDPRPMVRAAVLDLVGGVSPSIVSARFHHTIADATVEIGRSALALRGDMPVVLSGGCFQNALLTDAVMNGFDASTPVLMNRAIPPGDGGIALGQAVIADAQIRAGRDAQLSQKDEVAVCV